MTTSPQITPAQTDDAVLQLEHDMVEIVRGALNIHERQAFEIAKAIVKGLRSRYGGLRLGQRGLYIPAPSKAERNQAVCREFDGTNLKEVMAKHGIKRTQVYRILHKQRGGQPIGKTSAKSPISSHEMRRHNE